MTLYDIFYDKNYDEFSLYDKDSGMEFLKSDILNEMDKYINEFLKSHYVSEINSDKHRICITTEKPYQFDAESITKNCIQWIKKWFDKNGKQCNAIVGISGGKDSSVVTALCVEALGKNRVVGVLMPNGEQDDIDMARKLVDFLDIMNFEVNIKDAVYGVLNNLPWNGYDTSEQTIINLPARIRMTTLYAISQSMNGRVANTCNLSEDWVGYSTRYGDGAGDFSPLSNLTVTEVKKIGKILGLPHELIEKVPSDGLCGKTDEDNLGFSYSVLDKYIRTGKIDDLELKEKIDQMHKKNLFKLQIMPSPNFYHLPKVPKF